VCVLALAIGMLKKNECVLTEANRVRVSIAFVALLVGAGMAGCGGGGGDDGASGGVWTVTLSRTSLAFTSNHDDPGPPPAQTVTVTTNRPGTSYFKIKNGGTSGLSCGASSCTLDVVPAAPSTFLNPGTTTGSTTVIGCEDGLCAMPFGEATVNWTFTITPGMNVMPESLNAVVVEGITPAPLELTFTHPSGTVQGWQASFAATSSIRIPLTLTPSSSAAPSASGSKIQAQIAPMSQLGTFTGLIYVRPTGTPRSIQRQVTYQVIPALKLPTTTTSFTINSSSTAADLQKNITIDSNYPANSAPINWTATEDSAWLQISPSSGSTAGSQLTLSLVQSKLERLPKGIHHASVVVSSPPDPTLPAPQPTRSNITIDVVLDMQLPLAGYAMPHVVLTGRTGETLIRGSGLTALPGTVSFNASAATAVNRVDDTLIRANHPLFNTAGTYALDVGIGSNALLLNRSRANIVTINPPAYAAASFASSGEKYAALFDDERNALYVADVENGEIERYRYDSGTWSPDALAIANLKDIALMPDGALLLALTTEGFTLINPATLSVVDTRAIAPGALPNRTLGVGNDGLISFARASNTGYTSGAQYDLILETLTGTSASSPNRYIRASGDGSVLYFIGNRSTVYKKDTRTGTYTFDSVLPEPSTLSVSRDGSRLTIDATRVVDSSFNPVANLYAGQATLAASVITAGGTRAYAYSEAGSLYAFNLNAGIGPDAPLIGSPIALPATVGAHPTMAVSLDGRTVFIAGATGVIVQPVPF
jgi:hypothetical protein